MNPARHLVRLLMLAITLSACANYEFTVNEKVVYTPLPLFSEYAMADGALQQCIDQTIEDRKITRAEDLLVLVCSHGGIANLDGIETFQQLQTVQLPHNEIGDIKPLGRLSQLQQINLADNALRSVTGLEQLTELYQLDLRDNPELDCRSVAKLEQRRGLQTTLPQHCR